MEDQVSEHSHSSYTLTTLTSHNVRRELRGNKEHTRPKKEKEKFGSVMHSIVGLQYGVTVAAFKGGDLLQVARGKPSVVWRQAHRARTGLV